MTRPCIVYKWERTGMSRVKVGKATARFHQFGIGFEEFNNGVGSFTTAIVEYADGMMDSAPVEMIQFTDSFMSAEPLVELRAEVVGGVA